MNKREIRERNTEIKKSIYAQIIVIYGIMCGMAMVSLFAVCSKDSINRTDLAKVLVDAFVPTTITVYATGLFEFEFIKKNKTVMAACIALMVLMSLFYTTAVCFGAILNDHKMTVVVAAIAIITSFASVLLLWWKTSKLGCDAEKKYIDISDGHICAVRKR